MIYIANPYVPPVSWYSCISRSAAAATLMFRLSHVPTLHSYMHESRILDVNSNASDHRSPPTQHPLKFFSFNRQCYTSLDSPFVRTNKLAQAVPSNLSRTVPFPSEHPQTPAPHLVSKVANALHLRCPKQFPKVI